MPQRKDPETAPLIPLQNLQSSQNESHFSALPIPTTTSYKDIENRRDKDIIEVKPETSNTNRENVEKETSIGTEKVVNTVNEESNDKDTYIRKLLEAIERNDEHGIKRLVEAGADPNATHPLTLRQEEYLYQAVWDDDRNGYKKIPTRIHGKPVWSMLQFASAACRALSVRVLLALGARANEKHEQQTALDVTGAAFHYGCPLLPHHFSQTVAALVANGALASVTVSNGTISVLHTAARLRCARAAAALLDAGAVWSVDSDGLTPLHYAVENKCEDTLQVLVSHGGIEVANSVSLSGASALFNAVAVQWAVGCTVLLRAGASSAKLCAPVHHERAYPYNSTYPTELTPLHLAIELNNVDIVDRILTLAEQTHVDWLNTDDETPLYTAIACERLVCVKLLLRHGASLRNINKKSNALHAAACNSNSDDILKYLLENFDVSEIINELDEYGYGPIHKAILSGPETVKMLLDKGADVRLKTENSNDYFRWRTPLHEAGQRNDTTSTMCASMIIRYDRTTIDDMDAMGRTPLIAAALNGSNYVVSTIIKAGALLSIYPEGEGKQSAIKMITAKLPHPTGFIEDIFNSFLYRVGHCGSTDSVVDYVLLTNTCEKDPLKTVEELVRCGLRKVLVHPLMETLLYLKWVNLLPIFCLFLGTYAIFVLTLNVFIGMVFYYGDRKAEMSNSVIKIFWVDIALLYGSTVFLVLQECICMHARGLRYWHSLETWLKQGSMMLGIVLPPWLVGHAAGTPHEARAAVRHAATVALLLSWLQMMFLVARFPRWGYYVLMMAKVATNIAKILLTSVFMVMGFAMSFMVQFQVTQPFDGPFAAFTKTIVMMASEFDYNDLLGKNNDTLFADGKTIARLIFIIFLVFVSIVLMNFIVGVAVNDIHKLTVSGNARRLQKQLELLCTLENLVYDGILGRILPEKTVNTINRRRFISKMVINPGTTKIWTVHCEDEENNYKIRLPTYLYQKAIAMPSKTDENEFCTTKVHNMVKMLYDTIIKGHETMDPYCYKQHYGFRLKSKLDDILHEMKKLKDVKEDLKRLQTVHCDEGRFRFSRQRSTC